MSDQTVQADAAAIVAMNVADLAAHLDGVDLDTLKAALAAEQAGAARKGAIAALNTAIDGHPEQAAAAAAAAEVEQPTEVIEPVVEPASGDPALSPEQAMVQADAAEITPLADKPADPEAVSAAPPRPHQSLVDQLDLRWNELKDFASVLVGEVEGELGDVLTFVRSKL